MQDNSTFLILSGKITFKVILSTGFAGMLFRKVNEITALFTVFFLMGT